MIDWREKPYSEEFIKRHINSVSWYDRLAIYDCQKLSEQFIEECCNLDYLWILTRTQKLSEEFIEKYADIIRWPYVSMYQRLSEDFIDKHISELNLEWVSKFQRLSPTLLKKYHIDLPEDNWLYKSTAFKKKAVQDTGFYECHKDYFIAYKAIRKDRYSIFNFQYKYEKGGVYETHADYTSEEDSFGFGVGTETYAKNYGYFNAGGSIVVRVKIYYKDVARVVHDGGKIRATRIEVLD